VAEFLIKCDRKFPTCQIYKQREFILKCFNSASALQNEETVPDLGGGGQRGLLPGRPVLVNLVQHRVIWGTSEPPR
jgi:hypothetical protein